MKMIINAFYLSTNVAILTILIYAAILINKSMHVAEYFSVEGIRYQNSNLWVFLILSLFKHKLKYKYLITFKFRSIFIDSHNFVLSSSKS